MLENNKRIKRSRWLDKKENREKLNNDTEVTNRNVIVKYFNIFLQAQNVYYKNSTKTQKSNELQKFIDEVKEKQA